MEVYDLHREFAPSVEQVEEIEVDLETLLTEGTRYQQGIKLSATEYEKLSQLIEPEQWAETLTASFERGELGSTIADVTTRLQQFDENYKQKLPGYLELIGSMNAVAQIATQSPGHRNSVVSCLDKVIKHMHAFASPTHKRVSNQTRNNALSWASILSCMHTLMDVRMNRIHALKLAYAVGDQIKHEDGVPAK